MANKIYTEKSIFEYTLKSLNDSIFQPSIANDSKVYQDYRSGINQDVIRCSYSFTNLTEYSDKTKNKFTCETVSYINGGTGEMSLTDIGLSRITTQFYENKYYHIDSTYYTLKCIYPTQVAFENLDDYFVENSKIQHVGQVEIIDCTEDFDPEHNIVNKTVFARFPDSKYINYKDQTFGVNNYNDAFTPNYLYDYKLTGIDKQAINIFNSSTGTLSLKSEYINNNTNCSISCKVFNEPDNFFAASSNSIEYNFLFKKLLPMKYEVPNNTYEVYLNEDIENALNENEKNASNKELTKGYNNTPLTFTLLNSSGSTFLKNATLTIYDETTGSKGKVGSISSSNGTFTFDSSFGLVYGHSYKCTISNSSYKFAKIIADNSNDNKNVLFSNASSFEFKITRYNKSKAIQVGNKYFGTQNPSLSSNVKSEADLKNWIKTLPEGEYVAIDNIHIVVEREPKEYIIVGFYLHDSSGPVAVKSSSYSTLTDDEGNVQSISEGYLPEGYKFNDGYIFYKVTANYGYTYRYGYHNPNSAENISISNLTFDTSGKTQKDCGKVFGSKKSITLLNPSTDLEPLANYIYIVDSSKTLLASNNRRIRVYLYVNNISFIAAVGGNQPINNVSFKLEGTKDSQTWTSLGDRVTNENGIIEYTNTSTEFTKYRLTTNNSKYSFIETTSAKEYKTIILQNGTISNSNVDVKLVCRLFINLGWSGNPFFSDNYKIHWLSESDFNALKLDGKGITIGSQTSGYFTYDALSQIENITGLWNVYKAGNYNAQASGVSLNVSSSNQITLNKGSVSISFSNNGYVTDNGQWNTNNVYFWLINTSNLNTAKVLKIERYPNVSVTDDSNATSLSTSSLKIQAILQFGSYYHSSNFHVDDGNAAFIEATKKDVTITFSTTNEFTDKTSGTISTQTPTIKDEDGETVNAVLTYESSNEDVATITGTTITIKKEGDVTITGTFAGNSQYNKASGKYYLRCGKKSVNVSFSSASQSVTKGVGDTLSAQSPTISPNIVGTKSYSSSNTSVATITNSGTITIKGAGSTTITCTFTPTEVNTQYKQSVGSYTLVVTIEEVEVTPDYVDITFTNTSDSNKYVYGIRVKTTDGGTYRLNVSDYYGTDASYFLISNNASKQIRFLLPEDLIGKEIINNEGYGGLCIISSNETLYVCEFTDPDTTFDDGDAFIANITRLYPDDIGSAHCSIAMHNGAINDTIKVDIIRFTFNDNSKKEIRIREIVNIPYNSTNGVSIEIPNDCLGKTLKDKFSIAAIDETYTNKVYELKIDSPTYSALVDLAAYDTLFTGKSTNYGQTQTNTTNITLTFANHATYDNLYISKIFFVFIDHSKVEGEIISWANGDSAIPYFTNNNHYRQCTVAIPQNVIGKDLEDISSAIYVSANNYFTADDFYVCVIDYAQDTSSIQNGWSATINILGVENNLGAPNPFVDDIEEIPSRSFSLSALNEAFEEATGSFVEHSVYGAELPDDYVKPSIDEYTNIQVEEMPQLYLPKNLSFKVYQKLTFTSSNPAVADIVYFDYNPETGEERSILSPSSVTKEGHQLKPKLWIHNLGESTISVSYPGDNIYGETSGVSFQLVVKQKMNPKISLDEDKFEIIRQLASTIDEEDDSNDPLSGYQTFQSPTPKITCEESIPIAFEYTSSNNLIGTPYGDLGIIIIYDIGIIKVTIKLKETKKYHSTTIAYQLTIKDPDPKTETLIETEESYYKVRFKEPVDKPLYRIYDIWGGEHQHLIMEINSTKEFEELKASGLALSLKHKKGHNIKEYLLTGIQYKYTYSDGTTTYKYGNETYAGSLEAIFDITDPLNGNVQLFDTENVNYNETLTEAYVRLNCEVVYTPKGDEAYYIFNKALAKRIKNDANSFVKSENKSQPGYIDYHLRIIEREDFLGGLDSTYPTYSENFETYGVQILNVDEPENSVAFKHAASDELSNYIAVGNETGKLSEQKTRELNCTFYVRLAKNQELDNLMVRHNYNDDDLRYQVFKCPFTSNNTDPDVEYSFASSIPAIAKPNSNGNVVIYKPGKVKIMIKSTETENFTSGEAGYILDIVEKEVPILDSKYSKYVYEMDNTIPENVFGCPEFTWNNTDPDRKLVFWIKDGGPAEEGGYITLDDISGLDIEGTDDDEELPDDPVNPGGEGGENPEGPTSYTLWINDNRVGTLDDNYAETLKANTANTTVSESDKNINLTVSNLEFYYYDGLTKISNNNDFGKLILKYVKNDFNKTAQIGSSSKNLFKLTNEQGRIDGSLSTSIGINYNNGNYTIQFKLLYYPVFSKNLYCLGYFMEYCDNINNNDRSWTNGQYAVDNNLYMGSDGSDTIFQCYSDSFKKAYIEVWDEQTNHTYTHSRLNYSTLVSLPTKLDRTSALATLEGHEAEKVLYIYYDGAKPSEEEELNDEENPSIIYDISDESEPTQMVFGIIDDEENGGGHETITEDVRIEDIEGGGGGGGGTGGGTTTNTLSVNTTSISISYNGITSDYSTINSFQITSNTDWSINSNKDWCTVKYVSGTGDSTNYVYVEPNNTSDTRTATLTISGTSVTSKTITISQSGTGNSGGDGGNTGGDTSGSDVVTTVNIANNYGEDMIISGEVTFIIYDGGSGYYKLVGTLSNNSMMTIRSGTNQNYTCTFINNSTQNPSNAIGKTFATSLQRGTYKSNVGFKISNYYYAFDELSSDLQFNENNNYNLVISSSVSEFNGSGSGGNTGDNTGGNSNEPVTDEDGKFTTSNFKKELEIEKTDSEDPTKTKKYKVSVDDGGNITIENGLVNHIINVLVKSVETDNFKPNYCVYNILVSPMIDSNSTEMEKKLYEIRTNPLELTEETITFECPSFKYKNTDPELKINYYVFDGGEIDGATQPWYATNYTIEFTRPKWLETTPQMYPTTISELITGNATSIKLPIFGIYPITIEGRYDRVIKNISYSYNGTNINVPETQEVTIQTNDGNKTYKGCVAIDSSGNIKVSSKLCNRVINVMVHFSATTNFNESCMFYNIKVLPKKDTYISIDTKIFNRLQPDQQEIFPIPGIKTNNTDTDEIGYYFKVRCVGRVYHGTGKWIDEDKNPPVSYDWSGNQQADTYWEYNYGHYCYNYETEHNKGYVGGSTNYYYPVNPNAVGAYPLTITTNGYFSANQTPSGDELFVIEKNGQIKYTNAAARYVLNIWVFSKETSNFKETSAFYNLEITTKNKPMLGIYPPYIEVISSDKKQYIQAPEIKCSNTDSNHKLIFAIDQPTSNNILSDPPISIDSVGNITIDENANAVKKKINVTSPSTTNYGPITRSFEVEVKSSQEPEMKINGSATPATITLTRTVVTGSEVFPGPTIEHKNTDDNVKMIFISNNTDLFNVTPKGALIVYKTGDGTMTVKIPKTKRFKEQSINVNIKIVQQEIGFGMSNNG